MDYFKLTRTFWDYAFENPEKIKPNHCALYLFIVEHCNRLGWKQKFGLPTTMAKDAIGIRSYNTYIVTLNDLVEFGLIELIEKSKNQYSSNIVAISNFDKAIVKALDKALINHDIKQSESIVQSIDSIDKQDTNKQYTINNDLCISEVYPTFDDFWNEYDKKVGDRKKLKSKFDKLSQLDKEKIMAYIPNYKLAQPDKAFRKNPETFLNNKSWNDEIIFNNNIQPKTYGTSKINQSQEFSELVKSIRSDGVKR